MIDRTGVSQPPIVPKEPIIFEMPLPALVAITSSTVPTALLPPPVVATRGSVKKPDPWLKFALVAAPAVAILAVVLLWSAHRHAASAAKEAQEIQARATPAVPASPVAQTDQPSAEPIEERTVPLEKMVAAKSERLAQRKRVHSAAASKSAEESSNASGAIEQPIVVQHMDFAKLDVVIEHGFENATASVLVDQKPLYSQELHGESKRRALLFKRTQGKESGSINLLPGKHDIVVRVQSPADGYDASKTLSEGFSQGSNRVLRIKCDKRKNSLDAVIQ